MKRTGEKGARMSEDARVVAAAAAQTIKLFHHMGLSAEQSIQALVTASACALSVASGDDPRLLKANVGVYCRNLKGAAKIA